MFEESLFDQQPAEPIKEGEFLYNYEIRSWESLPWVPKILGASAILNVLLIVVVGQASFLTAKGCDSPLVGRVCQVLDTIQVGTALLGTDREYVDAVYDKTELADMDVTFVDVSGAEPQFEYPEGYFQLANPEQALLTNDTMLNPSTGFPSMPPPAIPSSPDLMNVTPVVPKANPNPVEGPLPSGFGDVNTPSPKKGRGGKITVGNSNTATGSKDATANNANNPTIDPNAAANAQNPDEAKQDENGVYINKRPLKDQATETLALIDEKKVALDKSFKVIITGTLGYGKDGKTVVLKNPKPLPVDKNFPNDPAMVKLVQDWILAVGDAGWFGYLDVIDNKKTLKSRQVVITVEQNDTALVAQIQSELPTEQEAASKSSSLGVLLQAASLLRTGDEQAFLQSAKTTSQGNNMILNINLPKPQVQEMIQRKLAEAKASPTQPNSTAGVSVTNSSAAK